MCHAGCIYVFVYVCVCVWFASRVHCEAAKVARVGEAQARTDNTERGISLHQTLAVKQMGSEKVNGITMSASVCCWYDC